jgi:hypothetical protein
LAIEKELPNVQYYTVFCYKECWKSKNWTVKKSIVIDSRNADNPRRNSCFYRKFDGNMSLSAAEELEKRETKQAEAAADRKLAVEAINIAKDTADATNKTAATTGKLAWVTLFLAVATVVAAIVTPLFTHYLDYEDQQTKAQVISVKWL